jgi:hypothetical protein
LLAALFACVWDALFTARSTGKLLAWVERSEAQKPSQNGLALKACKKTILPGDIANAGAVGAKGNFINFFGRAFSACFCLAAS